jgi:RNA binding exosome subunit
MRYLKSVTLSVFAKSSEEDAAKVKEALVALVPLDFGEEKIAVKEETATGFNEQPIKVYTITLEKESHTNAFLKHLLNRLTKEQKDILISQRESRLDNDLNFFIRLDKDKWMNEQAVEITDSGRCFHIRMLLAAYPARRPDALVLVEKIFKAE